MQNLGTLLGFSMLESVGRNASLIPIFPFLHYRMVELLGGQKEIDCISLILITDAGLDPMAASSFLDSMDKAAQRQAQLPQDQQMLFDLLEHRDTRFSLLVPKVGSRYREDYLDAL